MELAQKEIHPFELNQCFSYDQKDHALWLFPFRYEGLPTHKYEYLKEMKFISNEQVSNFELLRQEGYIYCESDNYKLSVIGEIFLGQISMLLKDPLVRDYLNNKITKTFEDVYNKLREEDLNKTI